MGSKDARRPPFPYIQESNNQSRATTNCSHEAAGGLIVEEYVAIADHDDPCAEEVDGVISRRPVVV